jgi:transposase
MKIRCLLRFSHGGDNRPKRASRLALVSVMHYMEGLSDRQAAEAVRERIDWKYTLGLELTDPGFDFSVRIASFAHACSLDGGAEAQLLQALLDWCKRRGWLKARGRQRTDGGTCAGGYS